MLSHSCLEEQGSRNVLALFDRVAREHHDRVAVVDATRSCTYADLKGEVDAIAGALRSLGCGPGARVCLAVSHGVKLVASVLAVLRIGAAYVPIDTRHPPGRIAHIVRDSGASLVAYTADKVEAIAGINLRKLCLDELPNTGPAVETHRTEPSDLAYILYTSGSTGQPKGSASRVGIWRTTSSGPRSDIYDRSTTGSRCTPR